MKNLNILIISQRFWPESFRITSIAEELVKQGNKVTVVTGLPMYPKGYLFDGYTHKQNRTQIHNGVNILRCYETQRRNNLFFRFLNYYSYPKYAYKLLNKTNEKFDVVLINGLSPIMSALPGIKYAKKHGIKVLYYGLDLWPESLLAGGIKKGSLIYNHYKRLSAKIYSKCDKILVSTEDHISYIKKLKGCENLDIECLPQYAEEIFENIPFKDYKKQQDTINLAFAGNIGKAQSVETIIKAANILRNDKKYVFNIIGDGSEYKNCLKLKDDFQLDNVIFHGYKFLENMPDIYKNIDIMLVTLQNSEFANLTIPGKVQSYMASGKPILGALNGSTQRFINENEIGLVCHAGDYKTLASMINSLCTDDLIRFANNSKNIYLNNYSKKVFIDKLLTYLTFLKN